MESLRGYPIGMKRRNRSVFRPGIQELLKGKIRNVGKIEYSLEKICVRSIDMPRFNARAFDVDFGKVIVKERKLRK